MIFVEVTTAKDQVMQEVLRTSPEEKMTDFFSQLHRLESVMGRQQLLRNTLTPPLHTIFGGQSWIPPYIRAFSVSQRQFLLVLTFYLNVIFVLNSFPGSSIFDDELTRRTGQIDFFSASVWKSFFTRINQPLVIYLIRAIHFLLAGIQVVRKVFNSRILDSSVDKDVVVDSAQKNSTTVLLWRIAMNIMLSPKTFLLLLYDTWWTLLLFGFSALGIFYYLGWYVPCVLDVIPQIKYMTFLVDAIKANVLKICLTIFFCLILLYVYAVVTFLFMPNQVSNYYYYYYYYYYCLLFYQCWVIITFIYVIILFIIAFILI